MNLKSRRLITDSIWNICERGLCVVSSASIYLTIPFAWKEKIAEEGWQLLAESLA